MKHLQWRRRLLWKIGQRILLLGAAVLTLTTGIESQVSGVQNRVLLLFDARGDMLANIVVDRAIRSVLDQEFDSTLDVRSEYFESAQPSQDYPVLADWFSRKYSEMRFDVVVAIGTGALDFASQYGRDLFPKAQIVFWGREDSITNWQSDSPLTGVLAPDMGRHLKATVDLIYKLQPDLRQLIVVSGASAVDRRWEMSARTVLPTYESLFAVSYLSGLPVEELNVRLTKLAERTAIVFLTMGQDGAGRRLMRSDILPKIVRTASAPVYGTSSVFMQTGIVGGALVNQETLATETAIVVTRLLRGEPIRDIPIREGSITPTVNWRELRRWNIPETRIPPGTAVIQRDPTVWEQYKWLIIGTLFLCALQTALIVALMIHRTKRKHAEKSLRESRRLLQSTIDALNAQVVLLDKNGNVVAVNEAWSRFGALTSDAEAQNSVGKNYLAVCDAGIRRTEGDIVSDPIKDLISGARDHFDCIYESGQEAERKSWFQLRMNRFYTDGTPWVVMEHENITEIKLAHDAQRHVTGLLLRAQDEERRRIARDLHDVTVQNIAMIKADLTRVEKAANVLDINALEKLKECLVLSDQVMKELRTLSYLLHPPLLDELGLVPALQWFVRGFIERSGIQVELSVSNNIGRLATDLETALFRVVQESLANIHRHSKSPDAIISVSRDEEAITLVIKDHGRGISKEQNQAISTPGVGIVGMGERLRQLGGQLDIQSDERGTIITARIPTDTPAGKTATPDNP